MSFATQLMFMDASACGHAELERELLPRLHAAEQQRYRHLARRQRRETWLAGRALLLAALARRSDSIDATALRTDSVGGVRYQAAGVHLSLSHCRELFAVSVSSAAAGIDIEWSRPRPALQHVERIFSPSEATRLRGLPDTEQQDAFYTLWTLKEAACKAAGISIWETLRSACFDLDQAGFSPHPPFPSGDWRFMSACVDTGWRLALAAQAADAISGIECWRMTAPGRWRTQALTRQIFLHQR
jgi:4'-phosphopantetheinyl transferase